MTRRTRVLILGARGQFGSRIASALVDDPRLQLVCAGRNADATRAFVAALDAQAGEAVHEAVVLDTGAEDFDDRLSSTEPQIVVHCAGPFQHQDYRVAEAALACDAHYIDIADSRRFVQGITRLDAVARERGRRVLSGASSVPALSAAVLEFLSQRFQRMERVETAISPGNRSDRGEATTRAILSYVGRPYPVLVDGIRRDVRGWQSLRTIPDGDAGRRWVARCEVPDLDVLPQRFPGLQHYDFRAGLELRRMHFGLWTLSWLVRAGLIRDLTRWTDVLLALSRRWQHLGSDRGLMQVEVSGVDAWGAPLRLRWRLVAESGSGPQVPATPAVALVRRLVDGTLVGAGAQTCVGLLTLDELLAEWRHLPISTEVQQLDL